MELDRLIIVPAAIFLGLVTDGLICFCIWIIVNGDHSIDIFVWLYISIAMAIVSAVFAGSVWTRSISNQKRR